MIFIRVSEVFRGFQMVFIRVSEVFRWFSDGFHKGFRGIHRFSDGFQKEKNLHILIILSFQVANLKIMKNHMMEKKAM